MAGRRVRVRSIFRGGPGESALSGLHRAPLVCCSLREGRGASVWAGAARLHGESLYAVDGAVASGTPAKTYHGRWSGMFAVDGEEGPRRFSNLLPGRKIGKGKLFSPAGPARAGMFDTREGSGRPGVGTGFRAVLDVSQGSQGPRVQGLAN